MQFLHTMLRVRDLDAALDFFVAKLGLRELRRQGFIVDIFFRQQSLDETQLIVGVKNGVDSRLVLSADVSGNDPMSAIFAFDRIG